MIWSKRTEDRIFLYNHKIASKLFYGFTIIWIAYKLFDYVTVISPRAPDLWQPINWFQELLMPSPPSISLVIGVGLIAIILSWLSISIGSFIVRVLLFLLLLWLNALHWNYNFFSHIGHQFLLIHFLFLGLYFKSIQSNITPKANAIRWAYVGLLGTYTIAGLWKFYSLFKKNTSGIGWLHHQAVEWNSAVSNRIHDEYLPNYIYQLYDIPYIWEIFTLLIFSIQLVAILGAIRLKWGYLIVSILLIFHLYNSFMNNTHFHTTVICLLILFFPYHLLKRNRLTL